MSSRRASSHGEHFLGYRTGRFQQRELPGRRESLHRSLTRLSVSMTATSLSMYVPAFKRWRSRIQHLHSSRHAYDASSRMNFARPVTPHGSQVVAPWLKKSDSNRFLALYGGGLSRPQPLVYLDQCFSGLGGVFVRGCLGALSPASRWRISLQPTAQETVSGSSGPVYLTQHMSRIRLHLNHAPRFSMSVAK